MGQRESGSRERERQKENNRVEDEEKKENKEQRHVDRGGCGECGVRDWQVQLEVDKCLRALVEQRLRFEPEGH